MKTLINKIDKTIKRRMRLYEAETEEEKERMESFHKNYSRFKGLKLVALGAYIILPFFEKPGWCLDNPDIDLNTTEGYWFCNDADGTIANSNLPKLPSNVVNIIYILSLIIMFFFTKARDVYRQRDASGDTVTLQLWLTGVAMCDLTIVECVLNVNWS